MKYIETSSASYFDEPFPSGSLFLKWSPYPLARSQARVIGSLWRQLRDFSKSPSRPCSRIDHWFSLVWWPRFDSTSSFLDDSATFSIRWTVKFGSVNVREILSREFNYCVSRSLKLYASRSFPSVARFFASRKRELTDSLSETCLKTASKDVCRPW